MRITMIFLLAVAGCGGDDTAGEGGDLGAPADLSGAADMAIPLPAIPSALALPEAGQQLLLHAIGKGVQIYTCMPSTDADGGVGGYAWVFSAPDAMLLDEQMSTIGHHYVGPTWDLTDGSHIVGSTLAKAAAPSATAIPWLLLKVVTNGGAGKLAAAKYVHRLNTAGGVAPSTGCDAGSAGTQARVDYTADYYFWGP
jgi:uncharacterized protein DUF3455